MKPSKWAVASALFVAAGALSACGEKAAETPAPAQAPAAPAADPADAALDAALAGGARTAEETARDQFRHPKETLEFFGIKPDMKVVEVFPGGGWYTKILAPYLKDKGAYVAANYAADSGREGARRSAQAFREAYSDKSLYGDVGVWGFIKADADGSSVVAYPEAGTADMVLTFRNVHNWISAGYAQEAFDAFYAALKPGGVLGVVEHRLPEDRATDTGASGGYVKVSKVEQLAANAGFILDKSSEINANPRDTADHPFGVWTLPPVKRTSDFGKDPDPDFDRTKYDAIGESDRMTIRFVKPLAADGAMLE